MKLRRGLIAAATSVALMTGSAAVAPAYAESSQETQLSATTGGVYAGYGVLAVVGLGINLAFWGTVYNFLVNHGHVNGQIIKELPVF